MPFNVGDEVEKPGGDYSFRGRVVAVFVKRSGAERMVVEDARGLLVIFNESPLTDAMPRVAEFVPAVGKIDSNGYCRQCDSDLGDWR